MRILCFFVLLASLSTIFCQDVWKLCQELRKNSYNTLVRSPRNCSIFFNCYAGLAIPFPIVCNNGLVFSQAYQTCVFKSSRFNDCNQAVYGGRYNDPLCNSYPFGLNRDPANCRKFIPCFNHTSFPSMACQDNLIFNVQLQRCTTLGTTACNQNNPTNNNNNV
uniref:Chitin-binding type-2 domain-containing protein n=1 Tax=Octopus bimaculoides TaxID=37653 RepID=A0A0L8H3Z7_OCTBM